jgi:hypothetical protein
MSFILGILMAKELCDKKLKHESSKRPKHLWQRQKFVQFYDIDNDLKLIAKVLFVNTILNQEPMCNLKI